MEGYGSKLPRFESRRDESPGFFFIVDGERFPAHRNILSACSPVLYALLRNGMKETGERDVTLKEVKASTWRLVLAFYYGKEITLCDEQHGLEILECAQRFLLDDLESFIVNYLGSKITASNACDFASVASRMSNPRLKSEVLSFLTRKFSSSKTGEYVADKVCRLELEVFEDVVRQPALSSCGEFSVAYYVFDWLWLNPSCSREDEARLLSNIQIDKVDEADWKSIARRCKKFRSKRSIRGFQISCMDRLVNDYFLFSSSLPIPWDQRLVYPRNWLTFSFKQRNPVRGCRTSAGFEELTLGCVYHLVLTDTTQGKKVEVLSASWPKEFSYHLFVMDSLERRVLDVSEESPAYMEQGTWWNFADDSGGVVVGATVYFHPGMKAKPTA